MMRRAIGAGLAVCGIAACALVGHQPQRLPDGSYHASCNASLTSCLEPFERICDRQGYDVIAASESRRHDDLPELNNVTITSDAVVRCKVVRPLFGGGSPPSPPAPAPPAPTPPTPVPLVPSPGPAPAAPAVDGGVPAGPSSESDSAGN